MSDLLPETADSWPEAFTKHGVDEPFAGSLSRYLLQGIVPGGFTVACLENNLLQAVTRAADGHALGQMRPIMMLLYNEAPSDAWGSAERVKAWAESRRADRGVAS